jgi:protein-S-isoprenylcysteine O-methyltransferase Ste14
MESGRQNAVSLNMKRNQTTKGDSRMGQKQFVMNTDQMVAISVDVIGIILVLIGALIVHAHSNSGLGLGLYWLGFVLLIVALIIFVLTMRKISTQKTVT